MITEDYVSFENAKLLKEKGFDDEYTNAFYDKKGNLYFIDLLSDFSEHTDNDTDIAASTLYVAMKWLREVHNVAISVYVFNMDLPVEKGNIIYTCDVATTNKTSREGHLRLAGPYEEVCETAIKYCLENLI